ncbi:hypothetical protein DID88_004937 [Monilinia fructigena]|uniref:Uncharacterized protein n=1 Tax=Monilinia fructigena TaxID=38457 RepID=A0A395IQG6_9HELO|nr:hypothetical protein DID88_004937 [Monilinia fructigena]
MEEEMRLSVLRHKKAEEDGAMKLEEEEEDEAMKVEEEDEGMKVEEEVVEQNALNGAPFDLEDSMPLANPYSNC